MKILLLPLALLLGYVAKPTAPIQLKGYFNCRAALLDSGDALASFARTQRDCRNGEVVLAFEKRISKRDEKAVFEITDTVHVHTSNPARYLALTTCTTNAGKPRHYFVLFKADATSKKYLRNIARVWGLNAQNQLVAVPVTTIKCLNDDYAEDL